MSRKHGAARRRLQTSPIEPPVTELWYGVQPVERLLADLDTLARGQIAGNLLRVFTYREETLTAVPAWCAERGYALLLAIEDEREGDQRRRGRYRFDIRV